MSSDALLFLAVWGFMLTAGFALCWLGTRRQR